MIETTFTIKKISTEEALKEAEMRAECTAQKIDHSLNRNTDGAKQANQALEQMGKGMDSVQKSGGKIGGVMKNATEALKGMLSPIGLASAAFAALTALIVSAWEKAKQRLEDAKKAYANELKDAQAKGQQIDSQSNQDAGYLKRLAEINKMQSVDNATKLEAAKIIRSLTATYGDLGLSIDEARGKINGLEGAMRKQSEAAIEEAKANNRAQEAALQNKMRIEERQIKVNSWFGSKEEDIIDTYSPYSVQEQTALRRATLRNATQEDINAARDIRAQHRQTAYENYLAMNGSNADMSILPDGFKSTLKDSKDIERLKREMDAAKSDMAKAPEEFKQGYQEEIDILQKMVDIQRKIELASKMQNNLNLNDKERDRWSQLKADAEEYYKVLLGMKNIAQAGNAKGEITGSEPGKAVADASEKMLKAREERIRGEQELQKRQAGTETLSDTYAEATAKINEETAAIGELSKEYEALRKQSEEAFSASNDGKFASVADEEEYLRIEAQRLEVAAKIEEKQRSINELKGEQLSVSKALLKEQTDEAQKKISSLFKGIFGDMKESTDALRQRGGYLTNNNSVNGAAINKDILQTVIKATAYLSTIKNNISGAGVI